MALDSKYSPEVVTSFGISPDDARALKALQYTFTSIAPPNLSGENISEVASRLLVVAISIRDTDASDSEPDDSWSSS